MPRTDNDTWDLASSVGATATMVAAARAVATNADNAVIDDPFAEPLVRAVGVDFFTRLATGDLRPEDLDGGDSPVGMRRFADGMAARTRFFDDFFADAGRAGIRQAVILASGLDARCLPAGLAGRHRGVRDRPARGDRLQDRHAGRISAPSRPHDCTRSRSTCVRTGRPRWPAPASTRRNPPPGSRRACSATCRPRRRTGCWTRSTELSAPGSRLGAEGVPTTPGPR